MIANVATSVAHEGRAFERFTQHGPLAMLPMSDGRCSLVWCHPLERREELLSWSDEKFCRELQSAFGWRLGKITHAGKRSAYPLALTRAARAITHRTVLVGNAAQTLHPIAGQGFNLGMRDVMSLAETRLRRMSAEKTSVITAYCAAISSVDRAIAKQPLASRTALYIFLPTVGHRWLSGATSD